MPVIHVTEISRISFLSVTFIRLEVRTRYFPFLWELKRRDSNTRPAPSSRHPRCVYR